MLIQSIYSQEAIMVKLIQPITVKLILSIKTMVRLTQIIKVRQIQSINVLRWIR